MGEETLGLWRQEDGYSGMETGDAQVGGGPRAGGVAVSALGLLFLVLGGTYFQLEPFPRANDDW